MLLLRLLETQVQERPAAVAILAPGRPPLSYGELWQRVQSLAGVLAAAGATPETPVATVLPNGPEAAISFLGVASCATCVPLNAALPAEEMRYYLEDSGARLLILGKDGPVAAREVAADLGLTVIDIDAATGARETAAWRPATASASGNVALILHTSGTTSKPKLVPLTQANLVASGRNIAQCLALQPADRCLNVMPLFHIHGLVGVLVASITAGASVVCTPGFREASFLDWVDEFQPTWYSAVPTIHQVVASLADQYRRRLPRHQFRFIRSSSAALSPATMRLLEAGTGAPVIEAYGMTEASHQMASNPLPPAVRKPGSVGLPAGAAIAIMDEQGALLQPGAVGEVVIRGPGVMAGYGGQARTGASPFTNGWFRTGDLGRVDADGYLFLTGRLKEVINRGGEKISPREVDEALLEHDDVAQAVAFGVVHPTLGEDLVAVVVRRPGSAIEAPALREFLFARLAPHKIPSRIAFVDEIPKGVTGKVQRTSLGTRLHNLLAAGFVGPGTELEHSLEAIFRKVLGTGATGINDNFFALGGDSLSGMQAVAAINRAHGTALPATALFHHPTIAELAVAVERELAGLQGNAAALMREIDALSDEEVLRLLAEEEALARGRRD